MNQLVTYIRQSLQDIYPPREVKNITQIICCELLGQDATDYYTGKDMILSENGQAKLESILHRLRKNEPIQYIQGEAHFFGRVFKVAPGVLIPRPETEELVQLVVDECKGVSRILDIGTGSGCIAITLFKEMPGTSVTAWDVSEEALAVARRNNDLLSADVMFLRQNVFSETLLEGGFDVIVSNPPYITEKEKAEMEPNVLDWEPELALFVPNHDPLKFYRRIAMLGRTLLTAQGKLYFEINRAYSYEIANLLYQLEYRDIRTLKDISGNDRIVTATR